jgi:hypothetical protein
MTEDFASVEYLHPDSRGRQWLFVVYRSADGWYFEVIDASPHYRDIADAGPFLVAEHAMHAARTWIEGRRTQWKKREAWAPGPLRGECQCRPVPSWESVRLPAVVLLNHRSNAGVVGL